MSDLDKIKEEAVRSRAFIRGAETQLSKVIALIDDAHASDPPADPDPLPDPDPPTGDWREVITLDPVDLLGLDASTQAPAGWNKSDGPVRWQAVEAEGLPWGGPAYLRGTFPEGMSADGIGPGVYWTTATTGLRSIALEWWERRIDWINHRSGVNKSNYVFVRGGLGRSDGDNVVFVRRGAQYFPKFGGQVMYRDFGGTEGPDFPWWHHSLEDMDPDFDRASYAPPGPVNEWVKLRWEATFDGHVAVYENDELVYSVQGIPIPARDFGQTTLDCIYGGRWDATIPHDMHLDWGPVRVLTRDAA